MGAGPPGPVVLRVLLVEDDSTLRLLTCEAIEALGHRARACESAEAAEQMLRAGAYQVLLSDVGLGGRSGLELARQVRDEYSGMHLVLASGHALDLAREGLTMARLLPKPYDLAQLSALLDELAK
jgi:two-component system cell cycle response regulator CpdR